MKFETSGSSYSVAPIDWSELEDASFCWEPSPLPTSKISKQRETRDRDVGAQLTSFDKSTDNLANVVNGNSLGTVASGCRHATVLQPESSSAYLIWPPAPNNGSVEERAAYFAGLQKAADLDRSHSLGRGSQATTLLDLMTIRAFHNKALRRFSLGTALGFRTRGGTLTTIPAIIVFVGRKIHKEWLLDVQKLPSTLEGPGGVWCDVDVVEFSYYGTTVTPKEQLYTGLVEGLRGNDPCIGAGSQVASQETYGTLGGIVRSRTAGQQVGFLTNRHVAVDIDYPNQKMFHPLPPSLGPGVYLGAVERASSFVTDDLWYGVFAGMNPETFVRADGAFVPFTDTFDLKKITSDLKGVGEMGEVMKADLQAPIETIIGKHVLKVGRSSGLTNGVIMAYAVEYNDERSICYFTDFLVVGENGNPFDLEGDSGSLILLAAENEREKPRPFGIIWGGTANRGRLKLRNGNGPENWTSGVDLGRLLNLLDLELLTTPASLSAAIDEFRSYQLNLERNNQASCGTFPNIAGCKQCSAEHEENKTVLEDKLYQQRSALNEGVEELETVPSVAASAAGDRPAEEDLLKFAAHQEWRVSSSTAAANEGFDSSLSLGGALEGALPSSGNQEEKGKKEDLKLGLGLGEHDGKRRRFS